MHLTSEEEKLLSGGAGPGVQLAMRLIVNLGEFYHASQLIDISSAQISGVSYKTGGEGLLDVLRQFIAGGAKVRVPSYLNPAGMDLDRYREMGLDEAFAQKQIEIINLYRDLGVLPTCTCTPYLIGNIARLGEHLAWSESSAVAFVNSFFGARTNRESGISALSSAIIGKTPLFGLHRLENRIPQILVKIQANLEPEDYSLIGHYIGRLYGSKVPYFKGLKTNRQHQLKALGAAMAATGAVALFHVEYVTPEYKLFMRENIQDKITITEDDLRRFRKSFAPLVLPDLIAIGCPHTDIDELGEIAAILKGRKLAPDMKLWIFTSLPIKAIAARAGYVEAIEQAGGKVYTDTCMVVSPLDAVGIHSVLTNSAKAVHYLPSMNRIHASLCSLEKCLETALTGTLPAAAHGAENGGD